MRLLKINNRTVDIDDATAIGFTFQSYDVKEPGKQFCSLSNNFTIPLTANNLNIFGNPFNNCSIDNSIYDALTCDYWQGNKQLIKNGLVRYDQQSDRISLQLFQKATLWDELKLYSWSEFQKDYLKWVTDNRYIVTVDTIVNDFYTIVDQYATNTEHLILPMFVGNLLTKKDDAGYYVENQFNIWLDYKNANGGHFCAYAKSIFQFIEYKFEVNFLTSGGVFTNNIWDDDYATRIYTPIRNIGLRAKYSVVDGSFEGWYIGETNSNFEPLDDATDKPDKTLSDFVNGFFQHFNIIIDEFENYYRLARFDEIDNAQIVDWSEKLTGPVTVKPKIDGYNQNSYIKFGTIYENGSELVNSRKITCLNKNLDAKTDLFTIDANISTFINTTGGVIPNLSDAQCFETFQFFITGYESPGVLSRTTGTIAVSFNDGVTEAHTALYLQMPSFYSLSGEYYTLDEILKYPKFYEVNLWLNIKDIYDLQFFKLYYIKNLGGSFFLNKISGFNPEKSNVATKCELIKVNDKSPVTPPDLDYYVDGVNDGFVDGENDLFY